jgi:hypothetical protein
MYRIIILRKWQENRVTYRFCIDNTPVKNKTKRSKLQNGECELVRWKCEYFLLYVNKKNKKQKNNKTGQHRHMMLFQGWVPVGGNDCSRYGLWGGRRGRDRMVVGFTTTYAISAYHHWCSEFESRWGRGVQHYVIKFVSTLRHFGGLLRFPPPIKLTATI